MTRKSVKRGSRPASVAPSMATSPLRPTASKRLMLTTATIAPRNLGPDASRAHALAGSMSATAAKGLTATMPAAVNCARSTVPATATNNPTTRNVPSMTRKAPQPRARLLHRDAAGLRDAAGRAAQEPPRRRRQASRHDRPRGRGASAVPPVVMDAAGRQNGPPPAGGMTYREIGAQLGRSVKWAALAVAAAERRETARARGDQLASTARSSSSASSRRANSSTQASTSAWLRNVRATALRCWRGITPKDDAQRTARRPSSWEEWCIEAPPNDKPLKTGAGGGSDGVRVAAFRQEIVSSTSSISMAS